MGGGIDKDVNSDQHEKDGHNSPRRHSATLHFRQFLDKIFKMAQPQQHSQFGSKAQLTLNFQKAMKEQAGQKERDANDKLLHRRRADEDLYNNADRISGFDGQSQRRFPSDHFSRNYDLIERSSLFSYAQKLPKAAHLHIHFNSTLVPEFLLGQAKEMKNMYIWSPTNSLRSKKDFDDCELMFLLQPLVDVEDARGPNLFEQNYQPGEKMRFQYFREMWNHERRLRQASRNSPLWAMDMGCDEWLCSKLVFSKEEIDDLFSETVRASENWEAPENQDSGYPEDIHLQIQHSQYREARERARRAWKKFDGRTRMMKGLFNYERAFKAYTRKCLEEFVMDNVQYAEVRPNFMNTNQLIPDDGRDMKVTDEGMLEIIIEVYKQFMKDIGDMNADGQIIENIKVDSEGNPIYDKHTGLPIPSGNGHKPSFGGLKIIFCVPRSFSKQLVADAMDRCLKIKKKEEYRDYIAGFDLIGPEAYEREHPLSYFKEEFEKFQRDCERENVEIPFLFHCGETPDDLEGNLEYALKFKSKRIGHGYALPTKPKIMNQMKANNVCVEACPISNMVLGLTGRMDEHRMYDLLAHGVHCTVNSDNGTLFRSTLSHDCYEVMVGNLNMDLYSWRQLAKWSIDHSCMSEKERARVLCEWDRRWREEFVPYINKEPYEEARFKMLDNGIKNHEEANRVLLQ
ncbi:Metallo-dependent hydrolase [Xylariaceae sp. FL0662B]|nr:Metallo-dependent hydrolase [Xylariaceae sp. FL0662B]